MQIFPFVNLLTIISHYGIYKVNVFLLLSFLDDFYSVTGWVVLTFLKMLHIYQHQDLIYLNQLSSFIKKSDFHNL